MASRTSLRTLLPVALLCLLQSTLLHAQHRTTTSTRRVPESAPFRPVVDSTHTTLEPADPNPGAVTSVDMAAAPNGLELSFAELPGLTIRAAAGLTDQQKGALIEMVTQYRKSTDLTAAFGRIAAAGASIEIYFSSSGFPEYAFDNADEPTMVVFFDENDPGHLTYRAVPGDDTSVFPGSTVSVTLNEMHLDPSSLTYAAPTAAQFARTVMHELIHLIVPGHNFYEHEGVEEAETTARTTAAYDALFRPYGFDRLNELEAPESIAGLVVRGSEAADLIRGGARNDSLAGRNGHDTLYGMDGHDIVSGADGNDHLYGGPGENLLDGGRDDDRYEAQGTYDLIMDDSGTDVLIAPGFDFESSTFYRELNTLFIINRAGATIHIDRQWVPDSGIERFEFAGVAYTWEQVRQRVPQSGASPCDVNGEAVLCF